MISLVHDMVGCYDKSAKRLKSPKHTFPLFPFIELRQRAEEVSSLEQELHELQISAQQLTERRNQSQKHLEETQCCLEKQQKGIKNSKGTFCAQSS